MMQFQHSDEDESEVCTHPRPAFRHEWRALAAAWGFGGICNAVDALALPDPESAPEHVIEAARLLRFVAEDLGLTGDHPLASDVWRDEP